MLNVKKNWPEQTISTDNVADPNYMFGLNTLKIQDYQTVSDADSGSKYTFHLFTTF